MLDPDDFADDALGHIGNQAAHAVFVGVGLFLPLAWLGYALWLAPIMVAVMYGAFWEWGVQRYLWRRQFDWRDSLMDTACVMAGASMAAGFLTDLTTGTLCFLGYAALVLWGGLRRWK